MLLIAEISFRGGFVWWDAHKYGEAGREVERNQGFDTLFLHNVTRWLCSHYSGSDFFDSRVELRHFFQHCPLRLEHKVSTWVEKMIQNMFLFFLLFFFPPATCVAVRRSSNEPKLTDWQTFMIHYAEAEPSCQLPSLERKEDELRSSSAALQLQTGTGALVGANIQKQWPQSSALKHHLLNIANTVVLGSTENLRVNTDKIWKYDNNP